MQAASVAKYHQDDYYYHLRASEKLRTVPLRGRREEGWELTILDRKRDAARPSFLLEQDEKVDYIYHKVYEDFFSFD